MQKQSIYNENSNLLELMDINYYKRWLYHILDKDPEEALWGTNAHDGWGWFCERDLKRLRDMYRSRVVMTVAKISGCFSKDKTSGR